jgi:phytoene/squalene synthetase
MHIQNEIDEYATHGKELRAKIEKLPHAKDLNFITMALENQSLVEEEEGAPNQYNKSETIAQKTKAKFASINYDELIEMLVEGKE